MSRASASQPIKLGLLMDYVIGDDRTRDDFLQPLELVFSDGLEAGVIDRSVELVFREMDGLPRGSVKAVIDGFEQLVGEGCLAVYGPNISDNAVPVREEIERRFEVPALSLCGSEDWMGEWTFALPNGSMTDEPILWAQLLRKSEQLSVGVLVERNYIGEHYHLNFRQAAQSEGVHIVAEESIAQTGSNLDSAIASMRNAGASAIVYCGFGLGIHQANEALRSLDWDPPRYMGTALETGYDARIWDSFLGWVGLEQYDEENRVGSAFLDRFEEVYGRRPEYFNPLVGRDVATVFLHAFADAKPLSPRGVKEALERVKMLPAASGSPGTRISFGKWCRRGWMGAGYLVARTMDPAGKDRGEYWRTSLVGRYGED